MNTRGKAASRVTAAAIAMGMSAVMLTTQAGTTAAQAGRNRISATASTPSCTADDLGVWLAIDQSGVAAGTSSTPMEFTNLSNSTCTLDGFPTISVTDNTGQNLGTASLDHTVPAQQVTLSPGGTGYALLEYSDAIIGNCPPADQRTGDELVVNPPNQAGADHVLWDLAACVKPGPAGFLSIRVIAPGIGVRGDTG